ncbi:hypothetical protein SY88_14670 [Clostridiales bacterium PH28_bin88]|nr:hypothetical protein SY88_14670 [Clostridiales bacterium PH28_bin88]
MILVNTESIPGKEIAEVLGLVRGSTIRAKHLGKDILAVFRLVVGGEIKEYTEMLDEARGQAVQRMVAQAQSLGADAIVNIRFSTSNVISSAAEIMVYGTAVKLQ